MRVERSLDTQYGPAVENDPKRASSRRPAVLLPPVVAALKVHKARLATEKLAAEAIGELLFGPQNAPNGGHTSAAPPSNPEDLAMLKAELQQKLLQIEELEARARQDSNLRPSDS
jgi:hypothetical protein